MEVVFVPQYAFFLLYLLNVFAGTDELNVQRAFDHRQQYFIC